MPSQHNLWFLLIFFGFSIASWVFNQLREQAKIKQQRDRARKQYEEQLRTGRDPNDPQPKPIVTPSAPAALDERARRQAQLQELRMKQSRQMPPQPIIVARAPTSAPPTSRPGATIPTGPAGARLPTGFPLPPRTKPRDANTTGQPTPSPRRAADTKRQPPDPAPRVRTEEPDVYRVEPQPSTRPEPSTSFPSSASSYARAPIGEASMRPMGPLGAPLTIVDLRRAIVLQELLGQPVALRNRE